MKLKNSPGENCIWVCVVGISGEFQWPHVYLLCIITPCYQDVAIAYYYISLAVFSVYYSYRHAQIQSIPYRPIVGDPISNKGASQVQRSFNIKTCLTCCVKAVNAVLWQPGEQTRVSQTNKQTNKLEHWSAAVDKRVIQHQECMVVCMSMEAAG